MLKKPHAYVIVEKRDIVTNSQAFAIAAKGLAETEGVPYEALVHEIVEEARRICSNYSD